MAEPLPLPVNRIFDVVVVGAGLCGLALARSLSRRGQTVQVIEARSRLGGRVLSQTCPSTGQALDLGAGWFWPETEPRVAALLAEYGLVSKAQHDPGDALWLTDPNREAERRVDPSGIHAGAQRIQGGAASLVQALAADLPAGSIRTGVALQSLQDHGNFIELITRSGPALRARQVVLAVPARLLHEHITFTPALPETVWQALAATPTWMAAQAKSVTTFAKPFWFDAGHSGNAFVRHPQAVLGEVFDASTGDAGALGGFVALNAAQREHFQRGLPLLIDSQLAQLFGQAAQDGQAYLQDWAKEPWTCAALDRSQAPEPPQNQPLLRQALWSGRLFLGGSETATHGAGHMEGALESADRLSHALSRPLTQNGSPNTTVPTPPIHTMTDAPQAGAIASFAAKVRSLREMAPQRYRQHLTRLLSTQQPELLTQRALLAAADQVYSEALAQLDTLLPDLTRHHSEVLQGRHALTAPLLAPFEGWNKGLLEAALQHNASSCALSNFPAEHHPDAELIHAITLDLGAAWREFALELNSRLLMAESATADAV